MLEGQIVIKVTCIECGYECNPNYFGTHLDRVHNINLKTYYDKHYKKQDEGVCCECGSQQTSFHSLKKGYVKTCSKACSNKYRNKILFQTYGVVNNFQLQHIKEKSKETIKQKYGVDNISKCETIKQKKIDTCLSNYGVQYPSQSKEVIEKQIRNNMEKYGVANVMHVENIAQKAAINGGGRAFSQKYITKFGNEILIQGTYEKMFVDFCEKNNLYIEDGPLIEYVYNNKKHRYFIDFKVIVNNKVKLVEIKSTYWYNNYKEVVDIKNEYASVYAKNNDYLFHFIINDNNKKQINNKKFNIIME
jgi:hypothetical protein